MTGSKPAAVGHLIGMTPEGALHTGGWTILFLRSPISDRDGDYFSHSPLPFPVSNDMMKHSLVIDTSVTSHGNLAVKLLTPSGQRGWLWWRIHNDAP